MKKITCLMCVAIVMMMSAMAQQPIVFPLQDTVPLPPPGNPRMVENEKEWICGFGGCDEVESRFPGGQSRWKRFLNQHLSYPALAFSKKIEGTVVLQFIVCEDGTVCDIEATSGPEILRQAAVDVLKKTPKWVPATRGGKKIISYKRQPIVFRL